MAETSVKIPNTDQLIARSSLEWKRGVKYFMRKDCVRHHADECKSKLRCQICNQKQCTPLSQGNSADNSLLPQEFQLLM